MTLHTKIETRSADDADPMAAATQAVEELRTASETFRSQQQTELRGITERLANIETRLNRPAQQQTSEPDAERRAFQTYLRMGDRAPADELRTLIGASDPQGGYLTPPELSTEFIRELVQYSPIRELATVRTTTHLSVQYPKRIGRTNAKWKGETQPQEGSEPSFGQVEVTVKEINTYVDISNQLLADSGGVAEAEVRMALAEDFGVKEGAAFVGGDGALEPQGLLTATSVETFATGNAGTLGTNPADLLISVFYSLPEAYRVRGTWLLNGGTLAAIRKLKDGQGNYLWQPSYQAGQPEMILGRPVREVPDMPSIEADASPIMFGDIATAYRIVDRLALSILVNPYLRATEGITRIHATRRTGAAVVQPAGLKKIKVATS